MEEKKSVVISLGGSLIVPEVLDLEFIRQFTNLILKWTKKNRRFFIITGGGKTARNYQSAAANLGVNDKNDLDQIGIYTTYANASLLRSVFGKNAHHEIVTNYSKKIETKSKVIIGGGWKPGCSTDVDAMYAAKLLGAKRVINLSNIDCLYDKDPRAYSDAKPIKKLTFAELLEITGEIWNPGDNTPFDPIASRLAQTDKVNVIIANGKNLNNLENILSDKPFTGTLVKP
ncbi:MAG TPA: UMP kinase [Candidatus Paceibacterota bacterium]|nr:UMP kinase [Candidatus Pacearchaeota archaeon]HRZ50409.1 UMP kinase [Candidatus Paceibacterota bacterium]HSA36130.1 UMP kinase [Candidatus Paceibacterota bacterium]